MNASTDVGGTMVASSTAATTAMAKAFGILAMDTTILLSIVVMVST